MKGGGAAAAVLLAAATAGAGADGGARIVDLSHPFSAATVYWPTAEGFRLKALAAGKTEGGFYYSANAFCAAEHGGTHLDAPVHFAEGKPSVDRVPLRRLVGPGILVDVAVRIGDDADGLVGLADLRTWEEKHGRIPPGSIVLLRTGWGRLYSDPARYLGTADRGADAVPLLRFPGLHPEAAVWLVRERAIASVGIDTASIDRGRSRRFESHQVLAEAEVPVMENLAGLEALPPSGFRITALPMNIEGGSGAPLRVIAEIP